MYKALSCINQTQDNVRWAFSCEFIRLATVLRICRLAVHTPVGTIVHTCDFN